MTGVVAHGACIGTRRPCPRGDTGLVLLGDNSPNKQKRRIIPDPLSFFLPATNGSGNTIGAAQDVLKSTPLNSWA
jgi:hypothetical protein